MGSKNLHRKETKKPGKDAKKPQVGQLSDPVPEVQVVRKKRKETESW